MKLKTNTYLIGKHLKLPEGLNIDKECCMCKSVEYPVIERKKVFSSQFMDTQFINNSPWICVYCAVCLNYGMSKTEAIRCYSYIATEDKLIYLNREDILDNVLNPPNSDFVFCVTYAHKKHTAFKARVNLAGQNPYHIQTENQSILIDLDKIKKIIDIIQNWYTICKETATEPTWFTKAEIMFGSKNFKKIEEYGVEKYMEEDKKINPYRNSALLEFLCHILNKGKLIVKQELVIEKTEKKGQLTLF